MAEISIPFNRPTLMGEEVAYLRQAVDNEWISGDGPFSRRCQELLEAELGVGKVLLTTSCTHALEMAALLLDVGADDEIIGPSFTFVSTVNAFALRGCRPIFADIRRDTLNLDEERLAGLIGPRTRAVLPVHYAGVGCEMDAIGELAERHRFAVIEDNAHGLFARYRGRPLGTFGALATLSFHETKNVTCGEGGALLINDPALVERAEMIREKGTNRSRFFRGQVDKYTWVDLGSSYVLSDALAAFLYAQLERRDAIRQARRRIWETYQAGLADWAATEGVRLPVVPPHCEPSHHMFHLLMPSLERRTAFIAHLRSRGIAAVFHYQPLHLSPMGQRLGGRPGDCPITEEVCDQLVRLPFYNSLSQGQLAQVIEAILDFRAR